MGYKDNMFDLLTKDTVKGNPPRATHSSGPVKSVDLMAKQNATAHHTNMYHQVKTQNIPIYRRGEPFKFVIEFKERFQLNDKNLRVDLQTGANPLPGPGTLVQLQIGAAGSGPAEEGKNWSCKVIEEKESSIVVEVKPTCACPIGVWKMTIVTTQPSKQAYHVAQHCYIIFNPWCKDDAVYMENEAWRNEYVLNREGMAFSNEYTNVKWFNWHYGQFHPVTLPSALLALEMLRTKIPTLSDPIQVTRAITRAIGFTVLLGLWAEDKDGNYDGGTKPWVWTNSTAILKTFIKTRQKVLYAQCWVFATITCSVCRALGIPARVVTNFRSAHDRDRNLVIYTYVDMKGHHVGKQKDTVWNFHVWNDVWMTRPDLPGGYGGWQAIDSCPQEEYSVDDKKNELVDAESYVCGPMSVKAIKNGEIGLQYDAVFIFSEVNADQKLFVHDNNGKFRYNRMVTDEVGKLILTRAVGSDDTYEDITSQYKYQEASADERKAFYRAAKLVGKKVTDVDVPKAKEDDVFVDLMPIESVMIGKTFIMSVAMENRSTEKRSLQVSLGANSVQYTGVLHNHLNIGAKGGELYKALLVLAPEQKEIITVRIEPDMYLGKLSPTSHINIFASVVVDETHQVWVENDNVTVLQPNLTVEVPGNVTVGTPFTVTMKFTNPLARELKNCSFRVDSSCLEEAVDADFRNVGPNEKVSHQMELTAIYDGPCNISSIFHSDLVSRVAGSKATHVNE